MDIPNSALDTGNANWTSAGVPVEIRLAYGWDGPELTPELFLGIDVVFIADFNYGSNITERLWRDVQAVQELPRDCMAGAVARSQVAP